MKLTAILLTAVALQVSAAGEAQGVTLSVKNAPLTQVFTEIKKQTGYTFIYTEGMIKEAKKVNMDVKNSSLEQALNLCLADQPFSYVIIEKTVVISRKQTPVLQSGDLSPTETTPPPITVKGRVTDPDGNPVPGATVTVKGTRNATATDANGYFTLNNVDENATLLITGANIDSYEVKVNGKTQIDATVKLSIAEGEEIVIAYNKVTAQKNVSALTVVKGEQIQNLPNRSFDKSLQGLVPGLLVTSGTGQPGGGLSNFVLRGIATGSDGIFGSTVRNPLIVIDGVPVSQEPAQWNYSLTSTPVINPMAQLNSSDIETLTILKDAAAIVLYGSKASNGVILITTKKGKSGKTTFSFRHQTDIASRLKGKINYLNQQEYLDLLFETYRNSDPSLTDADIIDELKKDFPVRADGSFYPEVDWLEAATNDRATTISNEISMSGGNERSNFYLNIEYTKQNGIFLKTGYDRKSLRFNFENRPTGWFKLGLNTTLSYNIQDYATLTGGQPLDVANYYSPLNPIHLEDGSYYLNFLLPYQAANPIAASEYNSKRNTAFRGLSKIYGEFSFLKNFKFTSNLGIDYMLIEAKEKIDPRLFDDYTYSVGSGRVQERDTRNANLITTNSLRFDKVIRNNHEINILLAQEAQVLSQKILEVTATGFDLPTFNQINSGRSRDGRGYNTKQTLLSYFGQANYGYRSKYFFTASLRKDGSSLFGERNRFGTYWSTGVGWVLSSEKLLKGLSSWINYLKLRGSIGAAGNSFAIDRFARYDVLYANFYGGNIAVVPQYNPGNPDIKWEQTFTWDAGLEARLWKERIAFTADIYHRKTSDVVYTTNLPYTTGWRTVADNIGDMENKGIEISLAINIIKSKSFTWNFNSNWSTNKNILVKANVPLQAVSGASIGNEEGRNFNSFYLVRWAGVNPDDGNAQWLDADGKITTTFPGEAARKFVGKPQPDGFGAITNAFTYRNFTVSAMLYYQYGFQIYNSFALTNDGAAPHAQQDKRALDRWTKPGDIALNPKRLFYNSVAYNNSTRYLFDGDYIRLQNVTVSYHFPKKFTGRLGLSLLKVFAQAHNLAIWSKFPGEDPANVDVQGGAFFQYPNQRSVSLGLNVNF